MHIDEPFTELTGVITSDLSLSRKSKGIKLVKVILRNKSRDIPNDDFVIIITIIIIKITVHFRYKKIKEFFH